MGTAQQTLGFSSKFLEWYISITLQNDIIALVFQFILHERLQHGTLQPNWT